MLSSRSLKLIVLGLGLLSGGCDRQSGQNAQPAPSDSAAAAPVEAGALDRGHQGSVMPDFQLKDGAGKSLTLASLKGKPVLINLWATWCAPCVAELPQLDALAKGGLRVVTISQDLDTSAPKVPGFLKQKGAPDLEPWLDTDNELSTQYGVQNLPTSILYDGARREVWRVSGPRDWASAETAKALAEAH